MLVEELSIQNEQKMKQMEEDYANKFEEMKEDERNLKGEMNLMQKYSALLEREKLDEKNVRLKLEEELLQNSKNHEEEVQLRLKFESKLNNMHSIHRDLATKYRRALLDIETLQNTNELLNTKKLEIIEQLNKMKTEYAEQNTKMAYDKEKIVALERENKIKIDQVNELLEKTGQMQENFDKLQYQHQLTLKTVSEQKLSIDVYQSQIQTLKNEKTHLRQNEVEARMLKNTFEQKLRETAEELKKVTENFQLSQREVLGFSEIKKEREERIDKLKSELDILKVEHQKTDNKLSKTTINLEKTTEQLNSVQVEYHNTVEKLKKINKARNDKESRLSQEKHLTFLLRKEIRELKNTIKSREHTIDDNNDTIRTKDKEISRLNSEIDSLEKKTALQINQLNEKIVNISGLLLEEQTAREGWVDKFEKEQKQHIAANSELMQTKSHNKDLELQIKDLEIRLENMVKTTEHINKTCEKMQEKANQIMNKYENADRELKTKKQLLAQVEKQKQEIIDKRKEEADGLRAEIQCTINEHEMHYEDLLSRVRHMQDEFNRLKKSNELLEVKNVTKDAKIEKQKEEITAKSENDEKLKAELAEQNAKIKELLAQIKAIKASIEPLEKAKKSIEDKNTRLSVDLKKRVDELKEAYKKIKILERRQKRGSQAQELTEEDMEGEFEKEDIMADPNEAEGETEQEAKEFERPITPAPTPDSPKVEQSDHLQNISEKEEEKYADESELDTKVKEDEKVHDGETPEQNMDNPLQISKKDIVKKNESTENKNNKISQSQISSKASKEKLDSSSKSVTTNKEVEKEKVIKQSVKKLGQSVQTSTKSIVSQKNINIQNAHKETQTGVKTKDAEINSDYNLLRPLIDEQAQIMVHEKLKNLSPVRNPSDKSIPTAIYDRSEGIDSRNNQLFRDDSQETYQPNFVPQTERSDKDRHNIHDTRASVNHDYFSNSPILSKNSVHHMSNNSTVIPSSIKNDLSQIEAHQRYMNNPSPTLAQDATNSVEYTDEVQNTHRSDDLMNTSTELDQPSRQSMHPAAIKKTKLSPSPTGGYQKPRYKQFSQQPGFIDKNAMIEELPNREELVSNAKSREQSHHSNVRNQFSGNFYIFIPDRPEYK